MRCGSHLDIVGGGNGLGHGDGELGLAAIVLVVSIPHGGDGGLAFGYTGHYTILIDSGNARVVRFEDDVQPFGEGDLCRLTHLDAVAGNGYIGIQRTFGNHFLVESIVVAFDVVIDAAVATPILAVVATDVTGVFSRNIIQIIAIIISTCFDSESVAFAGTNFHTIIGGGNIKIVFRSSNIELITRIRNGHFPLKASVNST